MKLNGQDSIRQTQERKIQAGRTNPGNGAASRRCGLSQNGNCRKKTGASASQEAQRHLPRDRNAPQSGRHQIYPPIWGGGGGGCIFTQVNIDACRSQGIVYDCDDFAYHGMTLVAVQNPFLSRFHVILRRVFSSISNYRLLFVVSVARAGYRAC